MIIYAHFKCVFYTNLFLLCSMCSKCSICFNIYYYIIKSILYRVNNKEHFLLMLKMNKDCNLCIDHC